MGLKGKPIFLRAKQQIPSTKSGHCGMTIGQGFARLTLTATNNGLPWREFFDNVAAQNFRPILPQPRSLSFEAR